MTYWDVSEGDATSDYDKAPTSGRTLAECMDEAKGRSCCTDNRTLRRVIVALCLLVLGLIAYGFLHNAFLSAATAMAVGAQAGDFIA